MIIMQADDFCSSNVMLEVGSLGVPAGGNEAL